MHNCRNVFSENFRPHFLHHGIHVLLEWGWTAPGINFSLEEPFYDVFESGTLKLDTSKLNNIQEELIDHTLKQKGNYDAMVGLVTSFDWSVNEDGGFNCTTKLISQNVYSSANMDNVDFSKNIKFNAQHSKDKIIFNINSSSIDDSMLSSTDKLLSKLQSSLDLINELM